MKLYEVDESGSTKFVFADYEYVGKDSKYSELIDKLKRKYED